MTLALVFERHTAPEVWATFSTHPGLTEALWHLVRGGQAGWPQIQIAAEQFVAFLARNLPPEAADPRQLAELRARDLYLACAFGLRHPIAQIILENQYMPKVREVLLRLNTPEPLIADIKQGLCTRLIERQDAAVVRRGYSGRGDLSGWLCTCAVREARASQKDSKREVALEEASSEILAKQAQSPELSILTGELKEAFQEAFRGAVASLTSRERNLLRYHFLARLSIDQIGNIYHVHRATAARWVAQAQERLILLTRKRFLLRVQVNVESLPRIMEQIQSLVSLTLGKLLKHTMEHDPPPGG